MDPKYIDAVAKLLDPRRRELAPAAGDLGSSELLVRGVDVDRRRVTAVVSTPDVDRCEEMVLPSAFRDSLPGFMRNAVLMPSHTYVRSDGGPAQIGVWRDLKITKGGLHGIAEFHTHEKAEEWWQLYRDGHGKGFSVAWITREWEMRQVEVEPGVMKKIRCFLAVELLEISATPLPACREALARAASGVGKAQRGAAADASGDPIEGRASQLSNRQLTTAVRMIQPLIQKAIRDELSTDPGSPLCTLIQDVAEVTLNLRAQGRGGEEWDGYGDPGPGRLVPPGTPPDDADLSDNDLDDDDAKSVDPVEKLVRDILGQPRVSRG